MANADLRSAFRTFCLIRFNSGLFTICSGIARLGGLT